MGHGIGPDINFALARTRSTVAQGGEAEKDLRRLEKEYYLVQEFEENLASLRKSNPNHGSKGHVLGASSGKFSKTKRPFPNEGCNQGTENETEQDQGSIARPISKTPSPSTTIATRVDF